MLLEEYDNKLDAEGKEYLSKMSNGTIRMGLIIDDLLSLSKTTHAELRHDTVDLSSLARNCSQELQEAQPEHSVEVIVEDGLFARGDLSLLSVMFTNLFGNAFKFSSKVPHPRIEFKSLHKEGQTLFCISDNGHGFNMKYSQRIFAPFERLHTQDEFSGTGIGLAIVQRIVERHGGAIWAESAEGQGAKFFFKLPAPTKTERNGNNG